MVCFILWGVPLMRVPAETFFIVLLYFWRFSFGQSQREVDLQRRYVERQSHEREREGLVEGGFFWLEWGVSPNFPYPFPQKSYQTWIIKSLKNDGNPREKTVIKCTLKVDGRQNRREIAILRLPLLFPFILYSGAHLWITQALHT